MFALLCLIGFVYFVLFLLKLPDSLTPTHPQTTNGQNQTIDNKSTEIANNRQTLREDFKASQIQPTNSSQSAFKTESTDSYRLNTYNSASAYNISKISQFPSSAVPQRPRVFPFDVNHAYDDYPYSAIGFHTDYINKLRSDSLRQTLSPKSDYLTTKPTYVNGLHNSPYTTSFDFKANTPTSSQFSATNLTYNAFDSWKNEIESEVLSDSTILSESTDVKTKLRYQNGFVYRDTFRKLISLERKSDEMETEKSIATNLTVTWEVGGGRSIANFVINAFENTCEISVGNWLVLEKNEMKFHGMLIKLPTDLSDYFGFEIKCKNPPINERNGFTLKQYFNAVDYHRMSDALNKFVSSKFNQNMRKILLGNRMPTMLSMPSFNCDNVPNIKLNATQTNAVKQALQRELCIIQGPPGTGKTTTAAAIVYFMVKSNRHPKKVLVCAPSNVAADNLANKIKTVGLKVVRLYARGLEQESKSEIGLHNILMKDQEFKEAKNNFKRNPSISMQSTLDAIRSKCEKRILSEIDVLCCTCSAAGDKSIDWMEFDSLLIDECTQATEPVCLVPIVKCTGRVVLIGDQKQLGPVVKCQKALDGGLALSLFERLIELKIPHQLLQVQFRMHPSISSFPSKHFYENQLLDGVEEWRHNLPALKNYWRNSDQNMVFFQTTEKECVSSSGTSWINEGQAKLVQFFIQGLLQKGIKMEQIGVITPYLGQKDLLETKLGKRRKNIEVATVNVFQGREKDIIIFSTVRSNTKGLVGFLNDLRRLNVAITRAKYGMIIIGNAFTLQHNFHWNELLSKYQKLEILVKSVTQSKTECEGFRSKNMIPVDNPKFISKGITAFKPGFHNDVELIDQLCKELKETKLETKISKSTATF